MTPKSIKLLDPDGDHVEIYVDGVRVDSDSGLSHTSRFLDWLKELGVALPFEIEYQSVDVPEDDDDWWPPQTLADFAARKL